MVYITFGYFLIFLIMISIMGSFLPPSVTAIASTAVFFWWVFSAIMGREGDDYVDIRKIRGGGMGCDCCPDCLN